MNYYLLALIIALIIIVILYYNKFVSIRNKIEEAWSSIDFQINRKYELIETLTEITGDFSEEEKLYLNQISELKHIDIDVNEMSKQSENQQNINAELKKLFTTAETNPKLKSNQNFIEFQKKISQIEDETQKSIRYYNALVRDKNSMIEKFPNNIFAKIFNVYLSDYFNMQVSH
ncbi:MAG: LemA family protein [Bacteroidales bacterium]|nr:LemA family protein [Bacteroidales bacterium]MBN2757402.1 LemA family protein [Bacteroidales bacterium]